MSGLSEAMYGSLEDAYGRLMNGEPDMQTTQAILINLIQHVRALEANVESLERKTALMGSIY